MSTKKYVCIDNFIIQQSDAQARISKWQEDQQTLIAAMEGTKAHVYENMPMLHVKAFTFLYTEMTELIEKIEHHNSVTGSKKIDGIRFYLGVKINTEEALAPHPCLVVVGVSDFQPLASMGGDDVLNVVSAESTSLIYDFSYPCPSTCGNPGYTIMD